MPIKNWKKEVFTIPNFLSLFRFLLIPLYVYIYLTAEDTIHYISAGAVLTISCLTDLIDGKIARKFHMVSTLGMLLDPIADKATQFSLTLCLSLRYPVLYPVLALFVIKESFQLIACIIAFFNGKMLPGALMVGKVCTVVLFVSLILLVLFPDIPENAVSFLALLDAGFLAASFIGYICAYLGKNKKIQDLKS